MINRVCHRDATVMSKSHLGRAVCYCRTGRTRILDGTVAAHPAPLLYVSLTWLFCSGHCDSSCMYEWMDVCWSTHQRARACRTSLGVMSAEIDAACRKTDIPRKSFLRAVS